MGIVEPAYLSIPAHNVGLINLGVVCLVITIEPWESSIGHASQQDLLTQASQRVNPYTGMGIGEPACLSTPTHQVG
jgi:hypothetical protein